MLKNICIVVISISGWSYAPQSDTVNGSEEWEGKIKLVLMVKTVCNEFLKFLFAAFVYFIICPQTYHFKMYVLINLEFS